MWINSKGTERWVKYEDWSKGVFEGPSPKVLSSAGEIRSQAWCVSLWEYCKRVINAIRVCGVVPRYDILPPVCYVWVNCSGTSENLQQVAIDIDRLLCMVDLFEWIVVSRYGWHRHKSSWREFWFSVFQDYPVWSLVKHVVFNVFHKHVIIHLATYYMLQKKFKYQAPGTSLVCLCFAPPPSSTQAQPRVSGLGLSWAMFWAMWYNIEIQKFKRNEVNQGTIGCTPNSVPMVYISNRGMLVGVHPTTPRVNR